MLYSKCLTKPKFMTLNIQFTIKIENKLDPDFIYTFMTLDIEYKLDPNIIHWIFYLQSKLMGP